MAVRINVLYTDLLSVPPLLSQPFTYYLTIVHYYSLELVSRKNLTSSFVLYKSYSSQKCIQMLFKCKEIADVRQYVRYSLHLWYVSTGSVISYVSSCAMHSGSVMLHFKRQSVRFAGSYFHKVEV